MYMLKYGYIQNLALSFTINVLCAINYTDSSKLSDGGMMMCSHFLLCFWRVGLFILPVLSCLHDNIFSKRIFAPIVLDSERSKDQYNRFLARIR